MDKIFTEMFYQQPDEIIDGDYFYHNSWYENKIAEGVKFWGHSIEELRKKREHMLKIGNFGWDNRTLQNEISEFYGNVKFNEIINKIAADGKPFIDIFSSENMGLIPFIAKINPQIPCMATDIDSHTIKCLRVFINRDLPEYNINLASLDNDNMPIKDNSLDYVTSIGGASLNEVYRILKPGGCFVTIMIYHEWKFDMPKIYEVCNLYGKVLGFFTYKEIEELQDMPFLKEQSLAHNQFISPGFEIEVETGEKGEFVKHSAYSIKRFLYEQLNPRALTNDEKKKFREINSFDELEEDYGIEFVHKSIFYVLRKV